MIRIFAIYLFCLSCASPPRFEVEKTSYDIKYNETTWENFSLREKIAQMIMVRIRGDYYHSNSQYRKFLKKWIEDYGVGGVITFGGSIHGSYYNIKQFQKWSKYPLIVAADYERGLGQWMKGGTLFPTNMALAATLDTTLAYEQGKITGKEARALGVHISFSPVMDINNNPLNPIINFRSYSDSPIIVSQFGTNFIKGAQENGLISCVKHFPGHGNTSIDSHSSLPFIYGSRKDLEKMELYPFINAIEAGVKMVMVGHIALPGLDGSNKPASHSSAITTQLLRNELGFNGIIITDGLEMGGVAQSAWAGESAVRSIEAGADILLLPIDVKQSIDSIEKAVISGRISENRIDRSVSRIWEMKSDLKLFSEPTQIPFEELEKIIGNSLHVSEANRIAEGSITVVKDDNSILPFVPASIDSLAHIILSMDKNARNYLKPFTSDIQYTHGHVKEIFVNNSISALGRKDIINQIQGVNNIIVSLLVRISMDKGVSTIDSTHSLLLENIHEMNIPAVVFSFGSPYLPKYDIINTYVCVYGYGIVSVKAALNALWGRKDITGMLPVELNRKLHRGHGIIKKKNKNYKVELNNEFDDSFSIIDSAISSKIFPGAQIAIMKEGELLFSGGFGFHTYDSASTPVTKETIYDVASLTKILSTLPICMKLISQRKMSLEQKVYHFYPNFKGGGKERINIYHLLTHSSGIQGYIPFYEDSSIQTKEGLVNKILKNKLKSVPGTKTEYSDLGFILLSSIIEKITGESIGELSKSMIFNKLDMASTRYVPPLEWLDNIAPTEFDSVYRKRLIIGEVHDENAFLLGGVSGHAGIFSSAENITNYAQMWINGGLWNSMRIFKESQIKEFSKKQNIPEGSDFALGWDTPSQNGKSVAGDHFSTGSFGHLGFTGTSLWIDPSKEIIIVLLSNRVYPSRKGKYGSKEMYGIRREFYNSVMSQLIDKR